MNLITEEGEVLRLISPLSIGVFRECLNVGRIDREFKVFSLKQTKTLGNKIGKDLVEYFFADSFTEVMEGVMFWGIPVREAAEKCKSSIEAELSGEVSFRGCKSEIDEQERFKEPLGIIPFRTFVCVFVFNKGINKREVHCIKKYFEGIVGWDERGYFKVNKIKLPFGSHSMTSFWN